MHSTYSAFASRLPRGERLQSARAVRDNGHKAASEAKLRPVKALLALLLALALPLSSAFAQDAAPPPPSSLPEAGPQEAPEPIAPAPFDARAHWARFDAEQAARQAQLDGVDVRTPLILTLSLLVPAAALILTATYRWLTDPSSFGPFDALPHNDRRDGDRRVDPVNCWLAGAGVALALGTVGAGLWWRERRAEKTRLRRTLFAASNGAQPRAAALALRVGAEGVGLVLRGRL